MAARPHAGSETPAHEQRPPRRSVKPLKRPSQARARFTVQAIYDAFVRIWRRDGWERLTTRAVALETGISVGTLYEYFPNKLALLSGYVRHNIEVLVAAVEREAVQPVGLSWRQRVHQLVRLMCGVDAPELSWFHPQMLALEAQMAQAQASPAGAGGARGSLAARVRRLPRFASASLGSQPCAPCTLPCGAGAVMRYLLELDETQAREWAAQMERMCCALDSRRLGSLSCRTRSGIHDRMSSRRGRRYPAGAHLGRSALRSDFAGCSAWGGVVKLATRPEAAPLKHLRRVSARAR